MKMKFLNDKFDFFKNKKIKNNHHDELDDTNHQSTLSYIFQNDDQEEEEEDEWGFFVELDNISIYTKKYFEPKVIKPKIIPSLPTIQEEEIEKIEIQQKKATVKQKTFCYIALSLFILSFLLLF